MAGLAVVLDPAMPPVAGMARASDGDSFRLGNQRVRLLGIDAPELRQTCTDDQNRAWPCGLEARDELARLLARGEIDCRPEDTDQYGRLLAFCSIAQNDLGAHMVREGMAMSAGSYWREEQAARDAGRGIWEGGFDTPRTWRDDQAEQIRAPGWLSVFGL